MSEREREIVRQTEIDGGKIVSERETDRQTDRQAEQTKRKIKRERESYM